MKEPANKAKHQTATTTTTTALVTSSIRLWGHTHTLAYTLAHTDSGNSFVLSVLGSVGALKRPTELGPKLLKSLCMHRNHHFLTGPHATLLHSTLSTLDPHPSWQLGSARSYLRTAVPFLMMLGMSCRSQFAHLPLEWPKKASEFKSSCLPNCMQHIALQNKALQLPPRLFRVVEGLDNCLRFTARKPSYHRW